MSDDKKVIFSMSKVSKTYSSTNKQVLKDIYLSFFYGAKIGILGLNGSGKSSLLKIIAGVDKNYQGDVVFAPNYTVGYDFYEGLASVREYDKYGFIDSEGKYVIEPKYDLAFNFYNGIAKVFLKGKPFFIDKKGEIVISNKFTSLEFINKDLAVVTTTNNYKGVLNLVSNKLVIDTIKKQGLRNTIFRIQNLYYDIISYF